MPVYVVSDDSQDLCYTCANDFDRCSPLVTEKTKSNRVFKCSLYEYLDETVTVEVNQLGEPIVESVVTPPKLRWFTTVGYDDRKNTPTLQYWNSKDGMWLPLPYVECAERDEDFCCQQEEWPVDGE